MRIDGVTVEISPWLEWSDIVQTGDRFFVGRGAYIDLQWTIAKQDVIRQVKAMARQPHKPSGGQ